MFDISWIYYFFSSKQASMLTVAPHWMTHGQCLFTHKASGAIRIQLNIEYHLLYEPNQTISFSPIWYYQQSWAFSAKCPWIQSPWCPVKHGQEGSPCSWRVSCTGGNSKSVRCVLRATRLCERGSKAGVGHSPQHSCEDQLRTGRF